MFFTTDLFKVLYKFSKLSKSVCNNLLVNGLDLLMPNRFLHILSTGFLYYIAKIFYQ